MRFVEFEPRYADAYRRFRETLSGGAGAEAPAMPFSYYLHSPGITIKRHLVVDGTCDQTRVIGAVDIKLQRYVAAGTTVDIAAVVYPVSLGAIDRGYGMAGVFLFRKVAECYPLNFMLGMGRPAESHAARLAGAMGWTLRPIPYLFMPVRLGPLLQKRLARRPAIAAGLRRADRLRLFRGFDALLRAKSQRLFRPGALARVSHVARFDESIDVFWREYAGEIGFSLVRDAEQMNAVFPENIAAFEKLAILAGHRLVGFAVLLVPGADGATRFHDAKVATLVELSLLDAHLRAGVAALRHYLYSKDIDAIITNIAHGRTLSCLKDAGFFARPTSMYLAASKQLEALFIAHDIEADDMVITRGDGDGPIGLGVHL